jgi:hypothetical protein
MTVIPAISWRSALSLRGLIIMEQPSNNRRTLLRPRGCIMTNNNVGAQTSCASSSPQVSTSVKATTKVS